MQTSNHHIPTKPGDLWVLGKHRLLCGDSTDPFAIHRLMQGRQADLVVTDPPYGVAYTGKKTRRRPITNDTLTGPHLQAFLTAAFTAFPVKPGAPFYICAPSGPTQTAFRMALIDSHLDLRQVLVWVKHHFVISRQDYHNKYESILYGWKDGAVHYFIADRTQHTVWEIPKPLKNTYHPTAKPLALVSRAITNSSRIGDTVFDGFGGGWFGTSCL